MKHQFVILLALFASSLSATAQSSPDSVFIRPHYKNGSSPLKLDYSVDGKHWNLIDYTLFSSDYGPWGSEKKLHYVVLRYDGKRYSAEFIPSPKNPQVGITESEDLVLWKPQDYPRLSDSAFAAKSRELAAAAKSCVLKVPYRDVLLLRQRAQAAAANAKNEQENIIQSGAALNKSAQSFRTSIQADFSDQKDISPLLFGAFFEDISYAADGGLYAELVQNRDFEYTTDDHNGWNSQTAWSFEGDGSWQVSTQAPLHKNNPHYISLTTNSVGTRLINHGWNGICVKEKARYDLSAFIKGSGRVRVSLIADGKPLASTTLSAGKEWKQSKAVLTPSASADKAQLVIEPLQTGSLDIDFVSLFPQDTYKGRKNGLRKDLAQLIADLRPRFVRFPGGCASHGQGIDNIYHWQASIGELWERRPDMNLWHYHQSRGLGFYEYFLFCEDMGAEPLPVLAAGVPCQNSWRGGNGQQGGIPFERDLKGKPSPYTYNGKPLTMESYLQELLDLIEWANGDASTKWGRVRAEAGHPKPFNLKYLGIGNEERISPEFTERFKYMYDKVTKAHPEIVIVGTAGPGSHPGNPDYENGWKLADELGMPIMDEHYYEPRDYFLKSRQYDKYPRDRKTKVYLGEYAAKDKKLIDALAEGLYLLHVERNGDVVVMTSYAPLFARKNATNWNPDLIYFDNEHPILTCSYYVQQMFGQSSGNYYYGDCVKIKDANNLQEQSVVLNTKTRQLFVKICNADSQKKYAEVDLSRFKVGKTAVKTTLAGKPDAENNYEAQPIAPKTETVAVKSKMTVDVDPYSFIMLQIAL